jgi:hypothetical protein
MVFLQITGVTYFFIETLHNDHKKTPNNSYRYQGVIVLSGDLYHTRQAYLHRLVPVFNTSRTDTLSSMDRVDAILRDTHGRLIIQHDSDDFASLPKMPEYLN